MTTFDPIARARGYHNRMQDDSANARRRRAAISDVSAPTVAGQADDQYLQIVSTLPDATPDQIGRLLYQRRDGANDILYTCILTDAGSPKWVAVSELNDQTTTTLFYRWRSPTTGSGLLAGAYGAALTPAGELLVVDAVESTSTARIVRYNATTGSYIGAFGSYGTGSGQFQRPRGLVVNQSSGDIYVVDNAQNRVVQFNSSRTFVRTFGTTGSGNGQLSFPGQIGIDSSGNLYVSDGNNRIVVFGSTGTWLRNLTGNGVGAGVGQFSAPRGIAVNSAGEVFVSDRNLDCVQVFNGTTGAYVRKFGGIGTANGLFANPEGVALDVDGNVYVADSGNDRIQKFNSSGAYLAKVGVSGTLTGQMSNPGYIVLSGDNLYVTQANAAPRVQYYVLLPVNGVQVALNGTAVSARERINLTSGTGITIAISDDAVTPEADITITQNAHTHTMTVSQVAASSAAAAAGTAAVATATCGAGTTIVGGGCSSTGNNANKWMVQSEQIGTTQWRCAFYNGAASATITATATAICLAASTGSAP